ncbi:MAG: hypothetical protein L0220_32920 [Acidobacteria bacterium]|nr:hypothetical protein [Acidobacteriota bacterium]
MSLEQRIVGRFVKDALAAGYRLSVSLYAGFDTDSMLLGSTNFQAIMAEVFSGASHIFVHGDGPMVENGRVVSDGWVFIVPGNGDCIISDYSLSMESLLTAANKIADEPIKTRR